MAAQARSDSEVMAQKFGSPEKLGERFHRGVAGLFVVEAIDGMEATYAVERDGSDHVYQVNVPEMDCDCGDKKGLCKHLWRVMFETGDLPEIGVNVAATNATSTESDSDGETVEETRPPTHIVLDDEEYAQMLRAAGNLNMAAEIRAAFESEDGVHVGELDTDARKRVLDTFDMALGMSGFDGPTTDGERSAALKAKKAVQSAEPV